MKCNRTKHPSRSVQPPTRSASPHPLRVGTPKTGLTVTAQITSRYEGVVKTLHYQAGDMAIVGKARLHTPPPRDAIANTTLGTLRH